MRILRFILKNWKRCIAFAAVFAFAAGVYTAYNQHFTEQQNLSFVYSSAEKGRYPDGSRFEIYDLLSDEVLTLTLERLNRDGKFSLFYYLGFFFLSTSKHNESKCMVM